jgi:hypothetical protein
VLSSWWFSMARISVTGKIELATISWVRVMLFRRSSRRRTWPKLSYKGMKITTRLSISLLLLLLGMYMIV